MLVNSKEVVELVFFEGVEMPIRELNKETNTWEKKANGEKELTYQYTFVTDSEFAEKLVFFVSPKVSDLRELKGQKGTLAFDYTQKSFGGKTTSSMKLIEFAPLNSAK